VLERSIHNRDAFNAALRAAKPGDTVALHDGSSYIFMGGIFATDLSDVTIDFAGSSRFVHNLEQWPIVRDWWYQNTNVVAPAFGLSNCRNITITSSSSNRANLIVNYESNEVYFDQASGKGGLLDGDGPPWWEDCYLGLLPEKSCSMRPRLILIVSSADVLVENLTLLNSPYWTLTVEAVRAEIRNVNVFVDRNVQRLMQEKYFNAPVTKSLQRHLNVRSPFGLNFPDHLPDWIRRRIHQPMDLNTDGIDVFGTDIWVHDCVVSNDDDSVAVKPPHKGIYASALHGELTYNATRNVTVENMVLTGFGASIGSVPPTPCHPAVDQITFRNIVMPATGKGRFKNHVYPFKY